MEGSSSKGDWTINRLHGQQASENKTLLSSSQESEGTKQRELEKTRLTRYFFGEGKIGAPWVETEETRFDSSQMFCDQKPRVAPDRGGGASKATVRRFRKNETRGLYTSTYANVTDTRRRGGGALVDLHNHVLLYRESRMNNLC